MSGSQQLVDVPHFNLLLVSINLVKQCATSCAPFPNMLISQHMKVGWHVKQCSPPQAENAKMCSWPILICKCSKRTMVGRIKSALPAPGQNKQLREQSVAKLNGSIIKYESTLLHYIKLILIWVTTCSQGTWMCAFKIALLESRNLSIVPQIFCAFRVGVIWGLTGAFIFKKKYNATWPCTCAIRSPHAQSMVGLHTIE